MIDGLLFKAIVSGAKRTDSPGHVHWDVSCRCHSPVPVEMFYFGDDPVLGRTQSAWVEMKVRCRKCENCDRVRSWEWTGWATQECLWWPRSYFGTLTLSPEEQVRALAEAASQYAERYDGGFAGLGEAGLFRWRCAAIGKWITLFLKRIRKELKVPVRYVVVAEAHESGLPHFHMLVHEQVKATPDQWDTYQVLKKQWWHGHSSWNGVTVDDGHVREARYVCKYLAKSPLARVRASERYGRL